ncbi:hypothetical protein [Novosphingobium nitrogenifigens]|nr:hypothetical protein [Novosphingobium nitrogenifigens]
MLKAVISAKQSLTACKKIDRNKKAPRGAFFHTPRREGHRGNLQRRLLDGHSETFADQETGTAPLWPHRWSVSHIINLWHKKMNTENNGNYISELKRYLELIAFRQISTREAYDISKFVMMNSDKNSKISPDKDPRIESALTTFDFISQCEPCSEDLIDSATKAIERINSYKS